MALVGEEDLGDDGPGLGLGNEEEDDEEVEHNQVFWYAVKLTDEKDSPPFWALELGLNISAVKCGVTVPGSLTGSTCLGGVAEDCYALGLGAPFSPKWNIKLMYSKYYFYLAIKN